MAEQLKVKTTPKAGDRVVIFERDPEHPDGEIFIAGGNDKVYAVGDTPAIRDRIHEGLLEEAKATSPKAAAGGKKKEESNPPTE